jgi:hypothetical protein
VIARLYRDGVRRVRDAPYVVVRDAVRLGVRRIALGARGLGKSWRERHVEAEQRVERRLELAWIEALGLPAQRVVVAAVCVQDRVVRRPVDPSAACGSEWDREGKGRETRENVV